MPLDSLRLEQKGRSHSLWKTPPNLFSTQMVDNFPVDNMLVLAFAAN